MLLLILLNTFAISTYPIVQLTSFVALKVRILPLHFQTPRHCYPIPLSPAKLLNDI